MRGGGRGGGTSVYYTFTKRLKNILEGDSCVIPCIWIKRDRRVLTPK